MDHICLDVEQHLHLQGQRGGFVELVVCDVLNTNSSRWSHVTIDPETLCSSCRLVTAWLSQRQQPVAQPDSLDNGATLTVHQTLINSTTSCWGLWSPASFWHTSVTWWLDSATRSTNNTTEPWCSSTTHNVIKSKWIGSVSASNGNQWVPVG